MKKHLHLSKMLSAYIAADGVCLLLPGSTGEKMAQIREPLAPNEFNQTIPENNMKVYLKVSLIFIPQ